jgi:hypothetical protein
MQTAILLLPLLLLLLPSELLLSIPECPQQVAVQA